MESLSKFSVSRIADSVGRIADCFSFLVRNTSHARYL